ncbi:MAG: hypothetical protein Fur0046_16400 [Cyanobacteria bacterium J069]
MGSQGAAVGELQTTLNRLGYYYGAINGDFDKATQAALTTFQRESGLVTTGELDDPTRDSLRRARAELLGEQTPLLGDAAGSSGASLGAAGPATSDSGDAEPDPVRDPLGATPSSEATAAEPESADGTGWIGWSGLLAGLAIAAGIIYSQLRPGRLGVVERDSALALDEAGGAGGEALPEPPLPGWSRAAAPSEYAGGVSPATPSGLASGEPTPSPQPDGFPIAAERALSRSQALVPASVRSPQPADPLKLPDSDTTALTETTRLPRISIVDRLLEELHSPEPATRRKAIWELGQAGDSRAVQPLVDLLVEADSQQCSLILATLSEIALRTLKPMKQALLTSLRDSNADVRKNAIRDVTRMYDVVTQMSDLLSHAVNDPDPEVQATARWAIAQLSRGRSLEELNGRPDGGSGAGLDGGDR